VRAVTFPTLFSPPYGKWLHQPRQRHRLADAPLRASEVPTAGKAAEPVMVAQTAAPAVEAIRPRGWLQRSGGWLR